MGQQLGVRRTYWGATQVDSAVKIAKTDLAAGRLPWISFKLPYGWADMAAGKGDAWIRDLATKLSKLNGPVWLAFHHEPEGDGDIKQWTAMQARLAPIVRSTAPNVAYSIVLTGWHQLYGDDAVQPGLLVAQEHQDRPRRLRHLQQVRRRQGRQGGDQVHGLRRTTTSPFNTWTQGTVSPGASPRPGTPTGRGARPDVGPPTYN